MARIKYNADLMKYISLFESLTGAKVKDCIVNDDVFFIVHENEMGRAIGRGGSNIKRVEEVLKKKIRLAEFNDDACKFVGNLIYPAKAKEIKEEEGIVTILCDDGKTKGMIIGRDRHNINATTEIVKRYFKIEEIKVG